MTVHFDSVDIIVQITKSRIVQLFIDHYFLIYLLHFLLGDIFDDLAQTLLVASQETNETGDFELVIQSNQYCTHELVNVFFFVVYL